MDVAAIVCWCVLWGADEPLQYSVEDLTAKYKLTIATTRITGENFAEENRTAWFTWRQAGDGDHAAVTLTVDRASMRNEGMYGYGK